MSRSLHLVKRKSGAVISALPFPEEANSVIEFGALVILSMLSRHQTVNGQLGLQWDFGAFKNTRMNYDVWTEILGWLLVANAQRLIIVPVIDPQHFPCEQERLEGLAFLLRRTESKAQLQMNGSLFAKNYQRRFEIATLLHASLNADPDTVNAMLLNRSYEEIRAILSTTGTAIINHLGIERTGTPLQMALYSHDETLFKTLADQMDPGTVAQQCQKVFDDCGVSDYSALIQKQIDEAKSLCNKLETEFKRASTTDITNALNRIAGTTSELQNALTDFNNLNQYVRDNLVHNPYILERLFEIYDRRPYDPDTECLFSQRAIGFAQKLSPARWLQHYAQGIYYLGCEWDPERPRTSFTYRDSSRVLDIRSHGVLSRLGVNSCIDIFGEDDVGAGYCSIFIKTFVEQKQRVWIAYAASRPQNEQVESHLRCDVTP